MWRHVLPILSCAFGGAACAASITDRVVDPEKSYGAVIVKGEIVSGDAATFNSAIQKYSTGIVLFDSGGGNLLAGIEIGTTIRLKGFATGLAQGALCASSCALAWLGGMKRFLSPGSKLGFHAAYRMEGGDARETGVGNAVVGAYLTRIGLPVSAVIYISQAGPQDMTWITLEDAKKVGIDVNFLNETQLKTASLTPPDKPSEEHTPDYPTSNSPLVEGAKSRPSFDCTRATRHDEKAICADEVLSQADALISQLAKLRRGKAGESNIYYLRLNNAHRETCHSDVLCILSVQKRSLRLFDEKIPAYLTQYEARLKSSGVGKEWSAVLPKRIGECMNTSIIGISDRFGAHLVASLDSTGWDSGSSAHFKNGGYVVSYSKEPILLKSKKGDRFVMCLTSTPKNCPPGDDRGREYRLTNVRTRDTQVMADSQHMCGGA